MKMFKNLLIGLMTLFTLNSFAVTTHTVTKNVTTNVTCMVGDTLKFYGQTTGAYGVTINSTTVIALHVCNVSPFYIGYYVITGGETSFTINGTTNWTGTITVQTTTGVEDIDNMVSVKVFPNPTTDVLKVTTDKSSNFKIFNMNGQEVMSDKVQEGTNDINVENLTNGVYFLMIDNKSTKFIKQ